MAGKKNSHACATGQEKAANDRGTGFERKVFLKKSGSGAHGEKDGTFQDVAGFLSIELNRYSEMIINISGISRIDTAGFQMLLKATRDSGESGRYFNFRKTAVMPWKISDLCFQKKGSEE